jgi:hypothetical protein
MGVFKRASEKVDQIIREEVDQPRRLDADDCFLDTIGQGDTLDTDVLSVLLGEWRRGIDSEPLGLDGTENPVVDTGRDTRPARTRALSPWKSTFTPRRFWALILIGPLTAVLIGLWFRATTPDPIRPHTNDGAQIVNVIGRPGGAR